MNHCWTNYQLLIDIYNNQIFTELPYIHVSQEYRRKGIGKTLFSMCCDLAKQMNASKLYIAAHSSVESQSFYRALGCILAKEINDDILAKEPLDL